MSIMRRSSLGDLASRAIAGTSLGRVVPLLLVCLSILLLVPDVRAAAPSDAGRAFGGTIQAALPDDSEPAARPAAVALDAEEVVGDPWQGSLAHAAPLDLDTGRRLIRSQTDLRPNAGRHVPERPPRLLA